VRAFEPEIIVASTDDPAHLMLEIALRSPRARVVYLVRATVALPFGPDSGLPSEFQTEALRQADGVVAVSEYVAQYTRQWGGVEAIHVPISLLDPGGHPDLGRFDNRFVSMVNPCAVKGISIFLALAERFPNVEFAAVPTWGTTAADFTALAEAAECVHSAAGRRHRRSAPPDARDAGAVAVGRSALAHDSGSHVARHSGDGQRRGRLGGGHARHGLSAAGQSGGALPAHGGRADGAGGRDSAAGRGAVGGGSGTPVDGPRRITRQLSAESRRAALEYARNLNAVAVRGLSRKGLAGAQKARGHSPAAMQAALAAFRRTAAAAGAAPEASEHACGWLRHRPHLHEDRASLARRATELARAAMPGVDVEILWDGMWVRRVGPDYFPDPDMFRAEPDWERWAGQARKASPRRGGLLVPFIQAAAGRCDRGYRRGPRRGCVRIFARGGAGRARLGHRAASGLVCGAAPVVRTQPAGECDGAELRVHGPGGELQIETLPVWESNYVRAGDPSPASYPVKSVRFDDLAAQHGIERIDFLKMNIEGAERQALPGCEEALGRARFVCIAAHDFRAARGEGDRFRTLDFVKQFVAGAGFEIVMRDDPRYYVPYHVHGRR
jgi:hypothetical protein